MTKSGEMATTEVETSIATRGELDLQEFVQNATWRELLMDLVSTNKLDPWDIDIVKVVDSYLSMVRKMKVLDLRVPANIILAASILLRMKSDTMSIFGIGEQQPEAVAEEPQQRIAPQVEALQPRARMQPRRKVTLAELMEALGDAMKLQERRHASFEARSVPVRLLIEEDDIDEKKESVLSMIDESLDREGLTTFNLLSRRFAENDGVLTGLFIPLLFLAQEMRISMAQESFFDEILIRKIGGDGVGRAAE